MTFKLIEQSLEKLMGYAQKGQEQLFEIETESFYTYLSILSRRRLCSKRWLLCNQYQTRYDQIKFVLQGHQ